MIQAREPLLNVSPFFGILQQARYRISYVSKWHAVQERTPLDWDFDKYLLGVS